MISLKNQLDKCKFIDGVQEKVFTQESAKTVQSIGVRNGYKLKTEKFYAIGLRSKEVVELHRVSIEGKQGKRFL